MKKLTICFAALLASFYGNTQQVRVGLIGGYHQATASPAFYSAENVLNTTSPAIKSGHVGVTADIPLSKKYWFLQTGLTYFKRGQEQNFTLDTSLTKLQFITAHQEQFYLDLPLALTFKLPLTKSIRFVVGGGPQLSFLVSGSETITSVDTFKVINEDRLEDLPVGKGAGRYKTSFVSLAGFAGFEFKNVYITANYSKALTDYYDRANENFRHESIGATLGLYIFRTKSETQPKQEKDSDNDGILDTNDECTTLAGSALTNGCPDKDGDGIADSKDACPTVAGVLKYNGCPIPDSDGDGLNDEEDSCPNQAGPKENKGCPIIEKQAEETKPEIKEEVVKQIQMSAKRISFKSGKTTLTDESYVVLDEVVTLLRDAKVNILVEGHSSLEGSSVVNQKLSQERADNVKNYLVSKGISEERITAIGYGATRPIINEISEKANIQNRRVEISLDK